MLTRARCVATLVLLGCIAPTPAALGAAPGLTIVASGAAELFDGVTLLGSFDAQATFVIDTGVAFEDQTDFTRLYMNPVLSASVILKPLLPGGLPAGTVMIGNGIPNATTGYRSDILVHSNPFAGPETEVGIGLHTNADQTPPDALLTFPHLPALANADYGVTEAAWSTGTLIDSLADKQLETAFDVVEAHAMVGDLAGQFTLFLVRVDAPGAPTLLADAPPELLLTGTLTQLTVGGAIVPLPGAWICMAGALALAAPLGRRAREVARDRANGARFNCGRGARPAT
ncbi:MAG: hypothetical protein AB7Q97_00065 [Gammaproteobacteria bacterium]